MVLPGITEPSLKYHPRYVSRLTVTRGPGVNVLGGQFDWGGLTESVTEVPVPSAWLAMRKSVR